MIKKVEDYLNDLIKFTLPKKTIDRYVLFLLSFYLLFLMLPNLLSELFESGLTSDMINSIFLLFIVPFIYIFVYNIKNKHHKNGIDFIFITLFMIIMLISTLLSTNPYYSFAMGNRHNGLLHMIVCYLIYCDSRSINNKDDVMFMLKVIFIYGIIQTLYGVLQVYLPNTMYTSKVFGHMASGLSSNPNFFGTLTLLLTSLSLFISLFISDGKFYKISTIIIYIGLIMAESSGPFFTFVLLFIGIILYVLIKRRDLIKKVIIWLVLFISLYGIVNYSLIYVNKNIYNIEVGEHYTISGDINSIMNLVISKFKKDSTESEIMVENHQVENINQISSGRLFISKEVIKYLTAKHSWLFGVGPDNLSIYYYVLSNDVSYFFIIDKAHNTYLNILAETGIFSLIVYVTWMVTLIVYGIKSKNKYVYLLLFGLIGYNIQGVFNINVIYVMPYYYIIAGMMMGLIEGDRHESRKH